MKKGLGEISGVKCFVSLQCFDNAEKREPRTEPTNPGSPGKRPLE